MRGWILLLLLLGVAACSRDPATAPKASEQQVIDRSVADVAAAEAAAAAPLPPPEVETEKQAEKTE